MHDLDPYTAFSIVALAALGLWLVVRRLVYGGEERARARLAVLAGGFDAAERLKAGMQRRYPDATAEQCYRMAIDDLQRDRR